MPEIYNEAMKRNEEFTGECTDLSDQGYGVLRHKGEVVFVPGLLPQEKARIRVILAKKSFAIGRVMERLSDSPERTQALCPVFGKCGGCALQDLEYQSQLAWKTGWMKRKFPGIEVRNTLGMDVPYYYRNKAQFPIGSDKNGNLVAGFYAGRTHSIIANTDCALGVPENREILEIVLAYMRKYHVPAYDEKTGTGLVRHVLIRKGFATGQLMVCLVINGKKLPSAERLIAALAVIPGMTSVSYSVNEKNTNVIMGERIVLLWGKERIEDRIGDIMFSISPLSFYQVNPVQTEKLYGVAAEFADLKGNETVWDLYCGIGTISLFLAGKAGQVYGVEVVPQAVADARDNAARNGIGNASFFVGKAEEVLPEKYRREGITADVIVVDPPRKGCDERCLATMLQMRPEKIVYVSCDCATLARDLKVLCGGGYELRKVQGVDLFGGTVHVEAVVLIQRKDT